MTNTDLSMILPRVLIVSRRTVRKNKFVDFVGEYHLDLIVSYGAVPVIVPRVTGVHLLLEGFEPIHGVVLCEGEDLDPSLYEDERSGLSPEELDEIRRLHASDTAVDREKDSIELGLAKLCLERNIPYLGICRGSQVLNVACGGTLYQDIEKELHKHKSSQEVETVTNERVVHMDYDNYDGHRHVVKVVEKTPLHEWFIDSLEEEKMEIMVNSYHHQGVKRLAQQVWFYDLDAYNPQEGKFIMGLQFHPERMRKPNSEEFDYPGCPAAYQEFVKAVVAYRNKLNAAICVPKSVTILNKEMENQRKILIRSFSIARIMYETGRESPQSEASALEACSTLSTQQEKRMKQMGATVRDASSFLERLRMNEEREKVARNTMEKMSIEQLSILFPSII
ncbi:hypothetical protein MKW92_036126 [Papaver armeniacum]|nr:hypothetical protein MKW92_036126 [Papaver armeniacum]